MQRLNLEQKLLDSFYWFNEPSRYAFEEGGLIIRTDPGTDFWQRTHYGFRNDNGHGLLTRVDHDFSLAAHFEFAPENLYDQCGVLVRIDEDNWIKASVEYENEKIARLGSVVTNLGYSDWATTDIPSNTNGMAYKISRRGSDFLIENSPDGQSWAQMRIAHLHQASQEISVGVYACSPLDGSFSCRIDWLALGENEWLPK